MMRPMKLAGDQLMFGKGCLEHLETLNGKRAYIISPGEVMEQNGILKKVQDHLEKASIESRVFSDVEPDPKFSTVINGVNKMLEFNPDIIIALGGGSAMDAAKAMWIYYEHPELKKLEDILPPKVIPKLRNKAIMVCIPSTSGTASEVSRSIVITDDETHIKHGIGNMEMMPDIAICDPYVTVSMPPKITAETGMDALTHAMEALVSNRENHISNILAKSAIIDIFKYLEKAYKDGQNIEYREKMLNASTVAGIAFTNVSLGIVHSMAHTLGSLFSLPHGLSNAILLPYIIEFNAKNSKEAMQFYNDIKDQIGSDCLVSSVKKLNLNIGIPDHLSSVIPNKSEFMSKLDHMAEMALKDGCTKTNPTIPTLDQIKELYIKAYE